MENNETIKQVLNDLLQKTIEKKIMWSSVNANAVRWVKREGAHVTTVTLQKQPPVAPPSFMENYVLTIQEAPAPAPAAVTQINTATDKDLKDVLAKIFVEANKESARLATEKRAEIIKNLLKGL